MNDAVSGVLVQAVFAYVLMATVAAICAVIISLIVMLLARAQKPTIVVAPPLTVSATPAVDQPAAVAAVIAAAVHTVMAAPRIIYLAEATDQSTWTHEARLRDYLSYAQHP